MPFPRKSGLCTWFPTHIILRRAEHRNAKVRINPASDAAQEHVDEVRNYKRDLTDLDPASFLSILEEVSTSLQEHPTVSNFVGSQSDGNLSHF